MSHRKAIERTPGGSKRGDKTVLKKTRSQERVGTTDQVAKAASASEMTSKSMDQ